MSVEPIVTVADLDTMPEDGNRYEVIEGELLVSKAPGVLHQIVSMNLTSLLLTHLRANPVGQLLATPGIVFDDTDAVIPDLAFIASARMAEIISGDRVTGPPDLIIEVLSPGSSNMQRDRIVKRQLYAKWGVAEYWIAEIENRSIEIYVLEFNVFELRATVREDNLVISNVIPGFSCKACEIFRF